MSKLFYADRAIANEDAIRRNRLLIWRVLRISLITVSMLIVIAAIAFPFVRQIALNRVYRAESSSSVHHFNLRLYWQIAGPEAETRIVICPYLLTNQANEHYGYGAQMPPSNSTVLGPRRRADEIWYGSTKLNYPTGTDTAIVELDGTFHYIKLSPTYISYYGREHYVSRWGFTLSHPIRIEIDFDALDKVGLLPKYAHYAKKRPANTPLNATTTHPTHPPLPPVP